MKVTLNLTAKINTSTLIRSQISWLVCFQYQKSHITSFFVIKKSNLTFVHIGEKILLNIVWSFESLVINTVFWSIHYLVHLWYNLWEQSRHPSRETKLIIEIVNVPTELVLPSIQMIPNSINDCFFFFFSTLSKLSKENPKLLKSTIAWFRTNWYLQLVLKVRKNASFTQRMVSRYITLYALFFCLFFFF